ncbi:hypothetical protein M3661_11180 [Paenibacillus sp. MER 180]|uniref:DUF4083 domain-containing protein n=1 Tax=Paenibacillus alvei TaxID=44250 RepID=A0ABT4ECV7_PAEAL|nr:MULTISPECIES: hypothetical protein [Paenibacillus]MCM3290695.1 hypothetical protein [Paenibacillus sp. MER 180]MCY9531574.1 hypothetical protein [Paenibacillus alvei]SDG15911.1 hypothetical protein SAMN04488689_110117 [Paenibacillus sp. cl6col]
MEWSALIISFFFLATLVRIEINTKKKLDNDKKIMKQLQDILDELKNMKN